MLLSGMFNRNPFAAPAGAIDHDAMVDAVANGSHVIVDVREVPEFRSGHIKGAINVPLSAFDPSRIPDGKPVIVYCASGGRSGMAMNALKASGRADVVNYRPGVGGWRMQGCALV